MRVLLIGGAGYIGSTIAYHLIDKGHEPVVFDSLVTGHRAAVPSAAPFIQGDCGDSRALTTAIETQFIDAVVHLAAFVRVEESVSHPHKYYANNTVKSLAVFDACARAGVKNIVFSSTAAVYGAPEKTLIDESAAVAPINPYGASKLASEFMLKDIAAAHGMRATILRYFNVAGADPKMRTGQRTKDATHLVTVCAEVATGKRQALNIYGSDYPTSDGTCVRDYIHVTDLAGAHLAALQKPAADGETRVFNCGYGTGHSVLEVAKAFEIALGKPLPVVKAARRAGDSAALVCDSTKLKRELGWTPEIGSLSRIVETALAWEKHKHALAGAG